MATETIKTLARVPHRGNMQRFSKLIAIVLVAAAVAGCARNGDTTPTPTPGAATTPTGATPTGATPTVTPPVSPTIPIEDVQPEVRAVYVTSLTDSVAPNGTATVCWRVEGSGTIPHTAVHFDSESHPNSTLFGEYDLGAVYPDDGAPLGRTFEIPATFCGEMRDLTTTTYLRPHVLAPLAAIDLLGPEKTVLVGGTRNITFVNFLEVFPANFSVPVCWRVSGLTGTSTHTAVHWDDESHPNATGFGEYDLGAAYPGNATVDNVSVTVPGEFCASVPMPASGVLYMRPHIILNDAHHLGEERNVYVAPRVTVSGGLPASAAASSTVDVCWRSEGTETVAHTALHWDTTSHPNAQSFGEYTGGTVYPDNATSAAASYALPGPFCTGLPMPTSGTVYFRPHTIYSGGDDLGPEYSIRVA